MPVSSQPPESKFAYVVLVARRARQLMAGGRPLIDNPKNHKYTRVAEEEMQRGMLEFDLPAGMDGREEEGTRKKA
ncbi:MAG: DNA-directed RNA polymerase subunit omega [Candidatus Acidiferrales bacterium]